MDNDRSELRWGVEQRLEFIEFRLFWEGHVNRSDLMDQFGVSVNQASTDLNRYIGFAPDNMVYDKSARTYVRGPELQAAVPRSPTPAATSPSFGRSPTGSSTARTPGSPISRPTRPPRRRCAASIR